MRTSRPNILFIITDQQRYDTISTLGFPHMDTPTLDHLAKELVDSGVIGEIRHFNGRYAVDRAMDPGIPLRWIYSRERSGSGALGLLGSHLIDLMRFLAGEPTSVMAQIRAFIKTRKSLDP